MATKVNRIAELNGKHESPEGSPQGTLKISPIKKLKVRLRIRGTSPLIQHAWSEKSKKMMRDKHAGKKSKNRDVRDPHQEGVEAAYYTEDGKYGIPAMAIKTALVDATHKDLGFPQTAVRKAMFIECRDRGGILPLICDEPEIREDMVRVGQKGTDLRYRPYFFQWAVDVVFHLDMGWMQLDDLVNLIERAGFGVGVGEWRPEKGGEYGRFELDSSTPVDTEVL
jgi:hypothetical protein